MEEVTQVFVSLYKSYKHGQKINHFQTKGGSYREFAIRPHHHLHAKKKQKSFKHINKVPRMQGSPEMKRTVFRQRHCKLYTDSENSDTGDERHTIESKKIESKPQNRSAATSKVNSFESKDELSSSCNSSEEGSQEEETVAVPLTEAFVRQIAEDFHNKTLLLTLK